MANSLVVHIDGDSSGYEKALKEIEAYAKKFPKKVKQSTDKVDNQVAKSAKSIEKDYSSAFKKAGNAAKKGLGIAVTGITAISGALAAGAGYAVNLASNLQEVQNVVDVTFGDNAATINKWAKNAGSAFGLSELQAKQFTGTMGAMIKSMGLSDEAVLEMSTQLTGLAADFASFYNLGHEEAFEKIRSGISGETEPLKQLGINMSVANLEAYALSQGIKKSYDEMTQAEQATLRYNYLLQAGSDAQGDYMRTSDSFANRLRTIKVTVDELAASIGETLLPIASSALSEILRYVQRLGSAFDESGINGLASEIGFVLSDALTTIAQKAPEFIDAAFLVVSNFVQGLTFNSDDIIKAAGSILSSLVNGIADNIDIILPAATTIIAQLIVYIGDNADDLKETGDDLLQAIGAGIVESLDTLEDYAVDIVIALGKALIKALPFISNPILYVSGQVAEGMVEKYNEKIYDETPKMAGALENAIATLEKGQKPHFFDSGENLGNEFMSGLETYVSNAKTDIENDIGGTYADTAAALDLLKKAQDELIKKQEISKDTFDALAQRIPELKDNADSPEFLAGKIEEIETKLKNADDKLRDFNLRVDQSSKEIVIDVKYKVSGMPPALGVSTSPFVIPGNARGTLNAKRGLSAVNERGMELIEGKDGSFRYVDSKGAALTYLNSGDRVYTAEQTKKMFGNIRHLPGFANGLSGAGDKSITFDISGYINSNSAGIGRAIAEELIGGIQTGIDDGKTEVQKVLDGMNGEMLESEKKYLSEKERIERENYEKEYQEKLANAKDAEEIEKIKQDRIKEEAEQAQQDYLDGLQEAADNERQIYEALQKDIENQKKEIVENFEETAEAAFDAIEEIEQAQTEFADSLRSDELYETNTLFTLNGEEFTETGLKDWDRENEKLRAYNDTLSRTSERLQGIFGEDTDGFDEMMNMLREDPFGEGGKTLELMKNATDEELQKFVSGWQENRNLTAEIAKESFSDETEELKSVLENTFGQVPEDFFNIGDKSAEQFGEGFMQKLNEVWQEVRQAVFDSMSYISPAADYIGKFTGSGQVITNRSYSPTYNILPSAGESTQTQLAAIRNAETRERMRGGY